MKRKIKQLAWHSGLVVDQDGDDFIAMDGDGGDGSVVDDVDGGDGDHNENNYKKDQGKKKEGEVLRDVIARWLSEQWIHSRGKSKTKEIAKQSK